MKSAVSHWANLEATRDDSSMNLNDQADDHEGYHQNRRNTRLIWLLVRDPLMGHDMRWHCVCWKRIFEDHRAARLCKLNKGGPLKHLQPRANQLRIYHVAIFINRDLPAPLQESICIVGDHWQLHLEGYGKMSPRTPPPLHQSPGHILMLQ